MVVRIDDRTSMLLNELTGITGIKTSVIVRGMVMRCIEELIDKSGNWKISNEKNQNRKAEWIAYTKFVFYMMALSGWAVAAVLFLMR